MQLISSNLVPWQFTLKPIHPWFHEALKFEPTKIAYNANSCNFTYALTNERVKILKLNERCRFTTWKESWSLSRGLQYMLHKVWLIVFRDNVYCTCNTFIVYAKGVPVIRENLIMRIWYVPIKETANSDITMEVMVWDMNMLLK